MTQQTNNPPKKPQMNPLKRPQTPPMRPGQVAPNQRRTPPLTPQMRQGQPMPNQRRPLPGARPMNPNQRGVPPFNPNRPMGANAPRFNQQQNVSSNPMQQREREAQPQQQTPNNPFSNPKVAGFVSGIALLFGILLGAMMFGGSSKPVAPQGLTNVIRNPDITRGYNFCGRTITGEACTLYIMNSTRYDRLAESFFDEALRLTNVPKHSIAWANPKYAKTRIPPGFFVQILIPPVR